MLVLPDGALEYSGHAVHDIAPAWLYVLTGHAEHAAACGSSSLKFITPAFKTINM